MKKIYISVDEWKQKSDKEKRQTFYDVHHLGFIMNNKAFMEYTKTLRKLSNYKDILKCKNVLDVVELAKEAWFHAKTQIELIDVDKDILNYELKKSWKQELNLINRNILMWENIKELTEDNIPSKEYLDKFPFSCQINFGTVTYFGNTIQVTVLKMAEETEDPYVRIEEYTTNKGYKKISYMVANNLLVCFENEDNNIEKENKILLNLMEQTNNTITSYSRMYKDKSFYSIHFNMDSIETMYNIIIKCKQLGLGCEPSHYCFLD